MEFVPLKFFKDFRGGSCPARSAKVFFTTVLCHRQPARRGGAGVVFDGDSLESRENHGRDLASSVFSLSNPAVFRCAFS